MPPKAVLDTNIIFSRVLHELLGRAANTGGLLELIWSDELVAETTRVLVEDKGLDQYRAQVWAGLIANVFPTGRVDISQVPFDLDLSSLTSDPDDQHVCALAVAGAADYLFTFDKSFNRLALQALGVDVIEPDVFLSEAIDEDPDRFGDILASRRLHGEDARSKNSLTPSNEPKPRPLPRRPDSYSYSRNK